MLIKHYGLYDGVAKEHIRIFTSKSDEVAQRSIEYLVRDPNFDMIAGKDYVVNYLFTIDSDTGIVVDNTIHAVCSCASAIDAYKAEKKNEEMLSALKDIAAQGKLPEEKGEEQHA